MIRVVVCVFMAAARLGELALSRRNVRTYPVTHEGAGTRRTYPLVVLLHSAVIALTLFRGSSRPAGRWLALLLAIQPVRLWVLLLLGSRWNARAAVPEVMTVETRGPYRLVRHPNYAIVLLELLSLSMAFRMLRLAALGGLANVALLAVRIREEEEALLRLPGYREHFEAKARLIPWIL